MGSTTSLQPPLQERHAGNGSGNRPRAIGFVDLVFECDAIAVGRVVGKGPLGPAGSPEYINFEVAQSFRRSLPNQIQVSLSIDGVYAGMFQRGEHVLLFLTQVEGARGTLFGFGDTGKWPRTKADWVFTAGHVQPLKQVVGVIGSLLQVDGMKSYTDRAVALTRSPFVDTMLGQIAALQYAMAFERWPEDRISGEVTLSIVQSLLSAIILIEKRPLDLAAEVELFQLLEQAPPSVAIPKWIEGLMHQDVAIRDTAFAALQTVADEDFQYDARQNENLRAEAVKGWQGWFDKHSLEFLKQDVPKLLDELRSGVMLRRHTANLLLRIISGQDIGFMSQADESTREAAAGRWEDWWKKTSMGHKDS